MIRSIIANALNNIGLTYHKHRDYPRALEYYQQSLALREQLNDKRVAALTLNNIGRFHREQGDHKRALDYYQQSLAIREKLDDQTGMAYVLNHIGYLHYLEGDYTAGAAISQIESSILQRVWRAPSFFGEATNLPGEHILR